MKKKYARRSRGGHSWMRETNGSLKLALLIVFAFPVGLYLMWTDDCGWPKWLKSAVSVAFVALIACALVVLKPISSYQDEGGVEIVAEQNNRKMLGPLKPADVPDTAQLVIDAQETSSLISEPTPTPQPFMVYCNDNGLYYHLAGCRYVYEGKTPRVTLQQALNAGKSACKLCKPPTEVTY